MVDKHAYHDGQLVVACFRGNVAMPEIERYFYWLVENHGALIKDNFPG